MKKFVILIWLAWFSAASSSLSAQTLFSDDFDANTEANWALFQDASDGIPDYTADFAFDYGAVEYVTGNVTNRIPAAPNSPAGSTKGLKITVNKDLVGATAAVSLYPKTQQFSGQFALRFDMWLNYNGPAFGGSGSTEFGTFGLNHAGDKPNWEFGVASDGVWFAVAGEAGAGTSGDYRAYVGDNISAAVPVTGPDAFLDRDGDGTTEYEVNPDQPATFPLKQMFPSPQFETPGAPGKHWVQVEVRQRTNSAGALVITWLIDGYVIAEHGFGAQTGQTAGNIMLGYMDTFASLANPAADNFVIFDNVRVVSLAGTAPAPLVSIAAADSTASEPGTDTGSLTVARTGDTTSALTVQFRTAGSAVSGTDFQSLGTSLVIPAGASSALLTVVPVNDQLSEPTENVRVVLSGSSNYEIREGFTASLDIADDNDGTPTVVVSTPRKVGYESVNPRSAEIAVGLLSVPTSAITVNFALSGSAVNGTDYRLIPTNVTIPAGQTNAVLSITPVNNSVVDGSRTVTLTLSPGNYLVGSTSNATVTIRDDDLPPGTLVYADNFDTDTTSAWLVNKALEEENRATFFYDYSADGIPSAPNSTNGTTRGLKLEANSGANPAFTGLSVSPLDQNFAGDYRLRFDMWINYNGPLNGGGVGSTLVQSAGIDTSGTRPQWAGGGQDSVWFGATGDGGSTVDYRAYSPAAGTGYLPASGVFAAGTHDTARNQADPYYASFGLESAPAAQLAIQPDQTGQTLVGTVGMTWRDVVISKAGTNVSYYIDGLLIAAVDTTDLTLGGSNIFLGYFDINPGANGNQAMSFGLVDNVRVESTGGASSMPITIRSLQRSGGNLIIEFSAPGVTDANRLSVQSTPQLPAAAGGWQNVTGVSLENVGGTWRATVPLVNEPMRFYRVGVN